MLEWEVNMSGLGFLFGGFNVRYSLEIPGDYKKLNFCDEGFYGISEV